MHKSSGFTLIEVLVALAILAIVMLAIGVSTADTIRDVTRTKQHMLATWVAENILTELQLGEITPSSSDESQSVNMNGMTWYWTASTGDAAFANFVPVTVAVSLSQGGNTLVKQTAYMVDNS